jgi:signal transduction histidine kinase
MPSRVVGRDDDSASTRRGPGVLLEDDPRSCVRTTIRSPASVTVAVVNPWQTLVARGRALSPLQADGILAAAYAAWCVVEAFVLVDVSSGERWAIYAICLAQAGGLAVRRRLPLITVATVYGGFLAFSTYGRAVDDELIVPFFMVLFAAYSLGANTEGRELLAGVALATALSVIAILVSETSDPPDDFVYVGIVLVGGPLLLGRIIRHRSRLNRALREKARQLEAERSARAEQAVVEERTRIAGEMHDVVAHALSAMVVQAGAARRLVDRDPARAADAFAAVEGTGREALTEIRRLLGVLRREDEDLALAPQPSLAHVSTLVRRSQAAGLPVTLHVEGDARPLPAGVDLTAYRVLQEALTSALDPGAAGHADIVLRYTDERIEVEVRDDGRGEASRRLLGMRERVALYGGEMKATRAPDGHAVWARLPVGGPA